MKENDLVYDDDFPRKDQDEDDQEKNGLWVWCISNKWSSFFFTHWSLSRFLSPLSSFCCCFLFRMIPLLDFLFLSRLLKEEDFFLSREEEEDTDKRRRRERESPASSCLRTFSFRNDSLETRQSQVGLTPFPSLFLVFWRTLNCLHCLLLKIYFVRKYQEERERKREREKRSFLPPSPPPTSCILASSSSHTCCCLWCNSSSSSRSSLSSICCCCWGSLFSFFHFLFFQSLISCRRRKRQREAKNLLDKLFSRVFKRKDTEYAVKFDWRWRASSSLIISCFVSNWRRRRRRSPLVSVFLSSLCRLPCFSSWLTCHSLPHEVQFKKRRMSCCMHSKTSLLPRLRHHHHYHHCCQRLRHEDEMIHRWDLDSNYFWHHMQMSESQLIHDDVQDSCPEFQVIVSRDSLPTFDLYNHCLRCWSVWSKWVRTENFKV